MRLSGFVTTLMASSVAMFGPSGDDLDSFASGQAGWAAGKPLPEATLFADGAISTPDDEMDATFTSDGRTIYFTKNHQAQRLGVIVTSHFQNG